ncbi:MAG: S9 family peptidase [Saprospiraceae bacterium]|nr:S9 family peptidase [Saprospiraceae bacterium]
MKRWIIFFMIFSSAITYAQSDFPYQTPDDAILTLADAKPAPAIRLTSDAKTAVLLFRNTYKSMEDLAAPEMKLAGLRINPMINAPSRITYFYGMKILNVDNKKEIEVIGLPQHANLSNFVWSNDQRMMAFTNTIENGLELWYLRLSDNTAFKLSGPIINANLSNVMVWAKDDKSLLITTLPEDRKELIDTKTSIPTGPVITENDGQKAQNRTFQDLLKNAYDEHNFEQLAISNISRIDLNGKISPFRQAAMYTALSWSPDGNYLLTYEIKKPFSYIVTYDRFPTTINILNKEGQFIKTFLDIALIEELPKGFMAVRKGPRSLQWRSDKPATLYWAEALDGGDPAIEVEARDAVYWQNAPFRSTPELLIKTKERYAGIQWGNDVTAVLNERWWNTRNARTLIFNPSDVAQKPRLFNERNEQDNYADPGSFVTKRNQYRLNTLEIIDGNLFMIGEGFTKEGKFPFIDSYRLNDFTKNRMYQSTDKNKLEQVISAIDSKKGIYLTRLESKSEYPNYYLRDINKKSMTQMTFHENPFKVLDNVYKEVIKYKRPDGVELSATLYLPVGYDKTAKEKMPMVMWAYPTEFKDKSSAGQVTSNANEFTFPFYGSPLYWLTKGYVVLDDASFPIVGEGKTEPNDSFIPQLVANAKAAIDAVDSLGYIDRSKVAVGGHSYGAFMTANLLTHSNLFAAGIARSGAYNRTLTPFGFQSEERNYWDAPEVYDAMSPFQHADKMKSPMLLIHGEDDNNPGTFTMQSERYFNALKGLGATARLVILPKESHGYAARESILHMLWEQDQWMEKYVKNRKIDVKP